MIEFRRAESSPQFECQNLIATCPHLAGESSLFGVSPTVYFVDRCLARRLKELEQTQSFCTTRMPTRRLKLPSRVFLFPSARHRSKLASAAAPLSSPACDYTLPSPRKLLHSLRFSFSPRNTEELPIPPLLQIRALLSIPFRFLAPICSSHLPLSSLNTTKAFRASQSTFHASPSTFLLRRRPSLWTELVKAFRRPRTTR